MSQGEFSALCARTEPGEASPTLTAWASGEAISPADLCAALDVDARLATTDVAATTVIDTATKRLEAAFPELGIRA